MPMWITTSKMLKSGFILQIQHKKLLNTVKLLTLLTELSTTYLNIVVEIRFYPLNYDKISLIFESTVFSLRETCTWLIPKTSAVLT